MDYGDVSVDVAANPDAIDTSGTSTITLGYGTQLAMSGMTAFGNAFGLPTPAPNAMGISTPAGDLIGFINPTMGGMPDDADPNSFDILGFNFSPLGIVYDPNHAVAGMVSLTTGGFSIGPLNLDVLDIDFTNSNGTITTVVTNDIGAQLNGLRNARTGTIMSCQWASARTWNPIGVNSSRGIPLMDFTNISNMFQAKNAYMLPNFIGGEDGIYSLRTGLRVSPPQGSAYPAPKGFSLGQFANYAVNYMLLVWSSGGKPVLLGSTGGDYVDVIDPSTGNLLVPDGYATIQIFNGSQQMNIINAPESFGWNYTGPAPSASNPQFNTSMAPYVGVSNYISNAAILTLTQYQNNGGPDGGPGR